MDAGSSYQEPLQANFRLSPARSSPGESAAAMARSWSVPTMNTEDGEAKTGGADQIAGNSWCFPQRERSWHDGLMQPGAAYYAEVNFWSHPGRRAVSYQNLSSLELQHVQQLSDANQVEFQKQRDTDKHSTSSADLDELPPWALKPRNEQRPKAGDDTMLQTIFAIFKSFIGCGILFLPSGFHFAGWAGSVFLLAFAAILNMFGTVLLSDCHRQLGAPFAVMVYDTLGSVAGWIVAFQIAFSQFCFTTVQCVFIAQTLSSTARNHGIFVSPYFRYVVQLLFVLPMGWIKDIGSMQWSNILATLIQVTCLVFIVLAALHHIFGEHIFDDNGHPNTDTMSIAKGVVAFTSITQSIPFLGTAVYVFEGVALLIPIRESMQQPQKFDTVFHIMMGIIFSILASFGLLGYLSWGPDMHVPAVINMLPANIVREMYSHFFNSYILSYVSITTFSI